MTRSNMIDLSPEILGSAAESKAWPFEEAKKIVKRYEKTGFPETVLFETGYISNPQDAAFLDSRKGRERIAESVKRAVEIHFARRLAAK